MFVYPATTAQKARELNKLGIEAEITAINWAQIRDRIFPQRIDKISAGGRDWRAGLPNRGLLPRIRCILLMLTQCRQSPGRNFMVARL